MVATAPFTPGLTSMSSWTSPRFLPSARWHSRWARCLWTHYFRLKCCRSTRSLGRGRALASSLNSIDPIVSVKWKNQLGLSRLHCHSKCWLSTIWLHEAVQESRVSEQTLRSLSSRAYHAERFPRRAAVRGLFWQSFSAKLSSSRIWFCHPSYLSDF